MIEIIPAIDIVGGQCVRLYQGDFSRQTVYDAEPVEIARSFAASGVRRLHMVDLEGAKAGRPQNLATLESVAAATDLVIDFGGGIRTDDDISAVFEAGARIANIGSLAYREPDKVCRWIQRFGGGNILLGADVKETKLAVDGWQTQTDCDVFGFLDFYAAHGLQQAFVTDIARDGAFAGPSVSLYRSLREALPHLQLIASGGIRNMDDVYLLAETGVSGAIIGKAIYEGRIKPGEIKEYVDKKNHTVS
jgi:phosphoribosylformimino-5-aminoimidazole carboxamide ribotide isomerase